MANEKSHALMQSLELAKQKVEGIPQSESRLEIYTRGKSKLGRCNICGDQAELTRDHVPPKGWIERGDRRLQLSHLLLRMGGNREAISVRPSQDGLHYRTICGSCNSAVLGARNDPALFEFVGSVKSLLARRRADGMFPDVEPIWVRPRRVMKSIVGHISAQGVDRYEKGGATAALTKFVLDDAAQLPDRCFFYYWPYFDKETVIARDFVLVSVHGLKPVHCWLIKSFPLAFLVTLDGPLPMEIAPCCLNPWNEIPVDEFANIPLRWSPQINRLWPEAPTEDAMPLFGAEAVISSFVKN